LREVLDVGAGTGFLGVYVAMKKGPLKKVVLSDLFLTPLFSSLYNAYANLKSTALSSVRLQQSNGLEAFVDSDRFDLVVCAPPYLPHLGVPDILSLDAVSGTYLMHDIIVRSGRLSNSLVMCYSSIAEPEFQSAVREAGKFYTRLYVRRLSELAVPFRVPQALRNKRYMNALLSKRGRYMEQGPSNSPFRYWHSIRYCMISYGT